MHKLTITNRSSNLMQRTLVVLSIITCVINSQSLSAQTHQPKLIHYPNGQLSLGGELYLPKGKGPFSIVLFNHGSAPGMKNSIASAAMAPLFTKNGWGFFMPYRRGQGLSQEQGPYIMDEINSARWTGWGKAAKKLVDLHRNEHLSDQLAALSWLKRQSFVDIDQIATLGNSFGGIQVVLGMPHGNYCAGIDAAGAAQSWSKSKDLQTLMKDSVPRSKGPIFFFQAMNDYDLAPTKELSSLMKVAGKHAEIKIYPAFGKSSKEGHSFPWNGVTVWFDDALSFLNTHCKKPKNLL